MFVRRRSYHGRLMGTVRSAQQKCVRRALLEPLTLLHLEHLLSEPDMSRAAMTRLQVIAVEDVGVGCPGLLPALVGLERGWRELERVERARRLIQAAQLAVVGVEASRFLPCWLVTLIKGVEACQARWRPMGELLVELEGALEGADLERAGRCVEELFLRQPLKGEEPLPVPVGLPSDVMDRVWEVLAVGCRGDQVALVEACRRGFGPPSRRSIASRLFLYMALVVRVAGLSVTAVTAPEVTDDEVGGWLERARAERFAFPDWVFDRHTGRGRRMGRGYAHFFDEAVTLARPSGVLGVEREEATWRRARAIYLEEERRYGRRVASTSGMRRRWRLVAGEEGER